ncbi:hypothetical protein ABZ876_36790 [Streptomyces sp. NPDC046931]|uniref:hypothetical protein n=1 Tax=Streptomyces sp. NPDC046931 TaxID=3154806 RepID=UPI0033D65D5C
MTTHLVRLQFEAGGPAVTGEGADGATARRTWCDRVGLWTSARRTPEIVSTSSPVVLCRR